MRMILIWAAMIAAIGVITWYMQPENGGLPWMVNAPECAPEEKKCADGSIVKREGPECAFQACPGEEVQTEEDVKPAANGGKAGGTSSPKPTTTTQTANSATFTVGYSQTWQGIGMSVTPLEVIEDSRCPSDATCVWPGTIKVRTRVGGLSGVDEPFLELGKPFSTGTESVTLTSVSPLPKINQPIGSNVYRFTFEVKKN